MIEPRRDLLLVGGGHTHALALRMLSMRPPPGLRMTLVSDTGFAPYSGMLPGLVAGHYAFEDTHIDLRRFCGARGIRFVEAEVTGIEPDTGQVLLAGRPPLEYDLLSINIGAQPELDSVPGAREYAVPVKPVSSFYQRWQALEERLSGGSAQGERILLVGGGAGSLELALAIRHRLGPGPEIGLLCGESLLPGYNRGAIATVRRYCAERNIVIHEPARATAVDQSLVDIAGGQPMPYDVLIWCTGAVPAAWLKDTGLPLDDRGFLRVEDTLQVEGFPGIFAAGDVAVQVENPRPRAGVFAVRQAPVLARNLAAAAAQRPLVKHRPQRRFLSLLSMGDKQAVADKGLLWASGKWTWRWKDRIDRKFMARFTETPPAMSVVPPGEDMHCGGCGAKLPSSLLRGALAEVATRYPDGILAEQLRDDAAVLELPEGLPLLQTVDSLRALVDDPWVMGRIVALHSLSDLYAMGATPHSAQVHACLPYAAPILQQRELVQLMSGLVEELSVAGCTLVGGHSMEGPELSLGLTVNGTGTVDRVLHKRGARPGDRLVMTKPLGTGVIFAAAMVGAAGGASIAAAIGSMLLSNRKAAGLAARAGARACTDITGFGLLGHLQEMLTADLGAWLDAGAVPLLAGTPELWAAGHRSTLHEGNLASINLFEEWGPQFYDPQTSGGLLVAVPPERAEYLLAGLVEKGHQAALIGEITLRADGESAIIAS